MKNKNIIVKKNFWTKRNIILLVVVLVVIVFGVLFALRYKTVYDTMLSAHQIYTFQDNIVKSVSIGENLLVGTDKGDVTMVTPLGKIIWRQTVKSAINTMNVSPDENYIIVGGTNFYLYDKSGKELFNKNLNNYFPLKSKFLANKRIKLLYQSLSDLSYMALTVNYTGKTLTSEKINDLGETASLDLSDTGITLFAGERGEVYKIENGKLLNEATIDTKVSTIHSIFGTYLNPTRIVVGYQIANGDKATSVPVYFYDANLKLVKNLDVPNNINSFSEDNDNIVFATDQGFFIYSEIGELQGQKVQMDLSALQFASNGTCKMYVFEKKASKENEKPLINVLLTDPNNNLIGSYLYTFDTLPQINLANIGKTIYISEKNKLIVLSK
jgi:hypothetical protein